MKEINKDDKFCKAQEELRVNVTSKPGLTFHVKKRERFCGFDAALRALLSHHRYEWPKKVADMIDDPVTVASMQPCGLYSATRGVNG